MESLDLDRQSRGDSMRAGRRRTGLPTDLRPALWLPPHPPLWLLGERLPDGQTRPHPCRPRGSRAPVAGQTEGLPRALCDAHGSSDRLLPPVRRLHGRPWSFAAPPQAGLAPDPPMRQLMTLHSKSASPSITSAGRCSLPLDPNAPRGVPERAAAGMRHTQPCGPVSAHPLLRRETDHARWVRPLRAGPNPLLTARARIERP